MTITGNHWVWRVITAYARIDIVCGVAVAAFLLVWLNLR
jgi:hypothetical protein